MPFFILILFSCISFGLFAQENAQTITTEHYELIIPKQQEKLLILFPCFPCDAAHTKAEFEIQNQALGAHTAVLSFNFNRHLWMPEADKVNLKEQLESVIKEYQLNSDQTYVGGFSSGGNVALLMSDYLIAEQAPLSIQGVFIVDSPIDLLGLHKSSEQIAKNTTSQEATFLVRYFEAAFGKGKPNMAMYEAASPYTSKTNHIDNLSNLKGIKIRLYTEPDEAWWLENRNTKQENTNAHYIKLLADDLTKAFGREKVELITTKNKGYRKNGQRHPHSWSIVDKKDLLTWMNKK